MADGPKLHRRHGFYVLVMVIGWVLPPIAVLLRFGFGTDFLLNILLTLCGYIPGHGHNFYLQNIRNNHNRKRTPVWATRAGLVKDHTVKRKAKTQWANRYDERTPTRADGYQDEDEQMTNNHTNPIPQQGQGVRIEQPLLDPESFIESSSTNSVEHRSLGSHRDHQPSTHSMLSSSNHPTSKPNRHASFTNSHPSSSPHRYRNSAAIPTKKPTNRNTTYDETKKLNQKNVSRRMTFDPPLDDNPLARNTNDDPYFIRRASTLNLSSSSSSAKHNHRKSTILSPTSVKSFPAKLGFGSKTHSSNPKDRFGLSRDEETSWEGNQTRRSPSYSPTTPTTNIPLNHHSINNDDDGLNHQF